MQARKFADGACAGDLERMCAGFGAFVLHRMAGRSRCAACMGQVIFHGEDDTLCDVDGSRQLFERSQVPTPA